MLQVKDTVFKASYMVLGLGDVYHQVDWIRAKHIDGT